MKRVQKATLNATFIDMERARFVNKDTATQTLLSTGDFGPLFIFVRAFDASYSSSRVSKARTASACLSVQGTLKLYLRASMVYNSITASNSVCGVF
jgi:hypothetical protein